MSSLENVCLFLDHHTLETTDVNTRHLRVIDVSSCVHLGRILRTTFILPTPGTTNDKRDASASRASDVFFPVKYLILLTFFYIDEAY